MKKSLLIWSIIFQSTLSICQITNINYYPLKLGMLWNYECFPGDVKSLEFQEKKIVSDYDREYNVYFIKTIKKSANIFPFTAIDIIENRNGRILNLGTKGGLFNQDWKLCNKLILEYPLTIGKTWSYIVEKETTECTVIDFVKLEVLAGTFENVCKIKIDVSFFLSSENKGSKNKKTKKGEKKHYISFDYYAPNVGLIKSEGYSSEKNEYFTMRELSSYGIL